MTLQKCAIEENKLGADTNTQDGGTDGEGTGANQANAALALINASTPEEIIGRLAQTGNDEYIYYIRNANFETIGYERFNAVLSPDNTSNKPWPSSASGPSKSTARDKAGDLGLYRDGDERVIPPSETNMESIIDDIRDIEDEGNYVKAKNTRPGDITSKRKKSKGKSSGGGSGASSGGSSGGGGGY